MCTYMYIHVCNVRLHGNVMYMMKRNWVILLYLACMNFDLCSKDFDGSSN